MTSQWLYQIRIKVSEEFSKALRTVTENSAATDINIIAATHGTALVCTFDAFSDYCQEAEQNETAGYPLYEWTKQTLSSPEKVSKHLKSFAFYKGDEQVYSQKLADDLFQDLEALLALGTIEDLKQIESNPKNNPQPPATTSSSL